MENQSFRKHFCEKMIAHFNDGGPENAEVKIEKLFSEMMYQEKKHTYIKLRI